MDIIKHLSIFDPKQVQGNIGIVGVGALGSAVAIQLTKLGLTNLVLFDHDKVEDHNLPNQILYGPDHIGMFKASAAAGVIEQLTGYLPQAEIMPVQQQHDLRSEGITHVFVCVDSMAARKTIFQNAVYLNPAISYYNEGRMSSTTGTFFGFNPMKLATSKGYMRDHLYSDDEVTLDRAVCGTVLSVGPTAMMLACNMVWHFMEYINTLHKDEKIFEELAFSTKNLEVHYKGHIAA